jgi:quinone-modifying oxidoreductase subunit QmoC
MQCGVCSGSCPLGPHWEHPPQELFMMIRANKREEVLSSSSMWMCTSCYNCLVRCPREVPITHIMHGLAHYAERLGLAPKEQPTRKFSKIFWKNLSGSGRGNETTLAAQLYFMNGFGEGVKKAIEMLPVGLGMLKAKRLNPFGLFAHKGVKDKKGLHAILAKAREIELAKAAKYQA